MRVMRGAPFILAFGGVGVTSWPVFGGITALLLQADDRTAILVATVASVLAGVLAHHALTRRAQISGLSFDGDYVRIVVPLRRARALHIREIRSVVLIAARMPLFAGTISLALQTTHGEEIQLLLEDPSGAAEAIAARNPSVRVERR